MKTEESNNDLENDRGEGSANVISLREERRLTGRYVAVWMAICITLLALYQAILEHTPMVAGLFVPAVIMFVYVFWVLYSAARAERRRLQQLADIQPLEASDALTEVVTDKEDPKVEKKEKPVEEKKVKNKLGRTYSIA